VKGKLPYLAPEQIMQMQLDRRVDIFALGTTLWESVTMRRLFVRDDDVETVKAVRSGPIPDPKKVVPALPEELAAIVRKALERNRAHRHATALELAQALDAFVGSRGANVPAQIGQVLTQFFPEEHKKQMAWLRAARSASMRPPPSMPPPR
jgi:serine/threonine-protein kinase